MKPEKTARAALRQQFNKTLLKSRQGREIIRDGRALLRAAKSVCPDGHPPVNADEVRTAGIERITAGVKVRDCGDRHLSLALAFCNNTPYSAAEVMPTRKPSTWILNQLLAPCFPEAKELEEILGHWLEGFLSPKTLFSPADDMAVQAAG